VTNGMVEPDILQTLLPHIDAVNIDVKSYSRDFYRRQGGNLGVVTTNLRIIAAYCHVEVTTLVIPGENDEPMEIDGLAEWISRISIDIPYHLTRFFPKHRMTDRAPTPEETLYRLAEVAGRHLRYVYIGNL
jgi:pyruvate formate lyase activating enzyme